MNMTVRRLAAIGTAGLTCLLLARGMAASVEEQKLKWRYWVDFVAATRGYLDYVFQAPSLGAGDPAVYVLAKRKTEAKANAIRIKRWQFWRRIGVKPFVAIRDQLAPVPPFEDPGRAMVLGLGFRVLRGVSPFLLLWLGAICTAPVLAWAAWELHAAGWPVAGTTLPVGLVGLPYFVDCLSLPYAPIAFYLMALVAVVPLAAYALLHPEPSPGGLLARTALAGAIFAGCSLCRSDTVLLAPGFLLAIFLGVWRGSPGRGGRPILFGALSVLAFLGPLLLTRPSQRHAVWTAIWEGLGDYDRTKGHAWSDDAAVALLAREGLEVELPFSKSVDATAEAVFRRSVLRDIRSDPVWYARILARRAFSVAMLTRLWASSGEDWNRPEVGVMQNYYAMTATVNWVGLGAARVRLPAGLMGVPAWLTGAGLVYGMIRGGRALPFARVLACGLCPAVAALGVPLAVTTASGMETQAFAAVSYTLGLGLGLDLLWKLARSRRREASRSQTPTP